VISRFSRIILIGLVSVGVLPTGAWAQAPAAGAKAPAVKDQGEYDIAQAAGKETDPVKKLELLKQWEQKYPDSDYKGTRTVTIASAESQIAMKALAPKATPADIEAAQKAAQDLIDNLDKYLSPENKPAAATDDQWKQAKTTIELQAHSVIAAVAASKKDDAKAEAEYKKILALDPNSASTAYSLGRMIYLQKNVARFPEALFWIARAVQITGAEALTPEGKTSADKFLKQAYDGYHGSDGGLDDLKKMASTATTLPPDLKIESQVDIAKREEGDQAAFNAAHPDIALWRTVRDALKADGGDAYFAQVKGAEFPPQDGAFKMFNAKVVSQPSPKELLVSVDNAAGDVTLKFESPLKGTIDPGTAFKFKGVVDSYTKEPYMLVLTADKEDVDGLPASAFAAAPPARRRAPKK
jgi:tetratricopeptide (TPR) repeat protein